MTLQAYTLPVPAPGRFGLNLQDSAAALSLQWATDLTNIVFDDVGLPASRKGTQKVNATSLSEEIKQIFEYTDQQGNSLTICSTDSDIYKLDGVLLTSISGDITTPTAGDWKFTNFNGKCIGFQVNHAPIVLDSVSGDFDDIDLEGSHMPTSAANEVLAAFGRLWTIDDNVLRYCDLLDETKWNSVYDLSAYWGKGGDIGVALAEFNGHLIVFGQNNILIYDASQGPDNLVKVENINGIGCIARDTVHQVGDDIWFLSYAGVRSLGRSIQEKSLPMRDISKNVRDYLVQRLTVSSNIKAAYSSLEGFYLLTIPSVDQVFCFDTKGFLEDGSVRTSIFDTHWSCVASNKTGELFIGKKDAVNFVAEFPILPTSYDATIRKETPAGRNLQISLTAKHATGKTPPGPDEGWDEGTPGAESEHNLRLRFYQYDSDDNLISSTNPTWTVLGDPTPTAPYLDHLRFPDWSSLSGSITLDSDTAYVELNIHSQARANQVGAYWVNNISITDGSSLLSENFETGGFSDDWVVTGDAFLEEINRENPSYWLTRYSGYADNIEIDGSGGSPYSFKYESPWTFIHPEAESRLKILKRASVLLFAAGNQTVNFLWSTDFGPETQSEASSVVISPQASQYGTAQYNLSRYAHSVDLEKITIPLSRTGQYFKFGIQSEVRGGKIALQSFNAQVKIGRGSV